MRTPLLTSKGVSLAVSKPIILDYIVEVTDREGDTPVIHAAFRFYHEARAYYEDATFLDSYEVTLRDNRPSHYVLDDPKLLSRTL